MNAVRLIPSMLGHWPITARVAQDPVANDQAAEGHGVAGQKEPHSKFAPILRSQGSFLGFDSHVYCSSFTHRPLSSGFQAK